MSQLKVEEARAELEAAQSTLDTALNAWDASVSELWRTSLALTQAQKRVTRAHSLLRSALGAVGELESDK
jgi:exonuclease VII small subunit